MDASMWVAKTGLTAQSTRMTVIANNLANVNTIGFKKDRANFEDLPCEITGLEFIPGSNGSSGSIQLAVRRTSLPHTPGARKMV